MIVFMSSQRASTQMSPLKVDGSAHYRQIKLSLLAHDCVIFVSVYCVALPIISLPLMLQMNTEKI